MEKADSILLKQGVKNDKGDKGQEGIKIQVEKQWLIYDNSGINGLNPAWS